MGESGQNFVVQCTLSSQKLKKWPLTISKYHLFIGVVPRMCAPISSLIQNGCFTSSAVITCYCNTDLCNPAVRYASNWILIGLGLVVAIKNY